MIYVLTIAIKLLSAFAEDMHYAFVAPLNILVHMPMIYNVIHHTFIATMDILNAYADSMVGGGSQLHVLSDHMHILV